MKRHYAKRIAAGFLGGVALGAAFLAVIGAIGLVIWLVVSAFGNEALIVVVICIPFGIAGAIVAAIDAETPA